MKNKTLIILTSLSLFACSNRDNPIFENNISLSGKWKAEVTNDSLIVEINQTSKTAFNGEGNWYSPSFNSVLIPCTFVASISGIEVQMTIIQHHPSNLKVLNVFEGYIVTNNIMQGSLNNVFSMKFEKQQ